MRILVQTHIESVGIDGYIASIPSMPGLVVQASTVEAAREELLTSLKVKIAYDYGWQIDNMEGMLLTEEEAAALPPETTEPCDDQAMKIDLTQV